jgi:flagellar basal body-associated protein FliL
MDGQETSEELVERDGTSKAILIVVVLVLALAAIFFFVSTDREDRAIAPDTQMEEVPPPNADNGFSTDDGNGESEERILPFGTFEGTGDTELQLE